MTIIVERAIVLALSALISLAAIAVLVQEVIPLMLELVRKYQEDREFSPFTISPCGHRSRW